MVRKSILHATLILVLALLGTGCSVGRVKQYKVQVVKEYPHDTGAYTQGLFFEKGHFYESTGQFGESTFREVELATGKVLSKMNFQQKFFAEGSVMLGDKLFILTWLNKVAFVYDAKTLEYRQTYSYPREGWGLTTDGKSLIASDGSARLYFMTPEFKQEPCSTSWNTSTARSGRTSTRPTSSSSSTPPTAPSRPPSTAAACCRTSSASPTRTCSTASRKTPPRARFT